VTESGIEMLRRTNRIFSCGHEIVKSPENTTGIWTRMRGSDFHTIPD